MVEVQVCSLCHDNLSLKKDMYILYTVICMFNTELSLEQIYDEIITFLISV